MQGPVVLVGHPFAPIGMGELLRATFRALRAVGKPVRVLDVYGSNDPDVGWNEELRPFLTDRVGHGQSIFCINGNEIAPVLEHLGDRAEGGHRIAYPAWELPKYPAEWARQVERFDEVWSLSSYTLSAVSAAVERPCSQMTLPTEIRSLRPLGRRIFGIPENSFVFLFFFDFTSFIDRKNPYAALEAFRRTVAARPKSDIRFAIKLNSSHARPEDRDRFLEYLKSFGDKIILIDRTLPESEVKSLHLLADAFVSLHRAEGYGFGIAEAMFLGKPVVATGYSGNMDFMTPQTCFPIGYRLIPVPEGAYPFAVDQLWAEPDVQEASEIMLRLVDDPKLGRCIGARARRHISTSFSYRAVGLRMLAKLEDSQSGP